MDEIICGFTLALRIRNISAERYIKVGNKSVSIFHADGFDKAGHGIRIIFTDSMVKRWECEIDVSFFLKSIQISIRNQKVNNCL